MEKESVSVVCGTAKLTLEFDKTPFHFQDVLCLLEKTTIGYLLKLNDGVKSRVAERLLLNRTTVVEKCRKYGFPLKKL